MREEAGATLTRLVRRCLTGDEDAWRHLVELITPVVYTTCHAMRLGRDESLDIFGQVCFLLLKNLENLRKPEKLLSYVATTTRREILAVRRRGQLLETARHAGRISQDQNQSGRTEDAAERAANAEILFKAMFRLPEAESKLIWHLFLDEKEPTYEEISEILGRPVSSIGPTRARILRKLKRILMTMGYKFRVF